ncbi:MAG: FAD-binding protein [Rhodobacterales bacterium]|nr:FAD-binding protein [Rhodobacterales bacterium]
MIPQDDTELAELLRAARGPLRVRGGGTRDIGRPVAGEVLSTAELRGVTLYEPGALTLVVRAGTPLAEVAAVLAGERQRLAFEPMDHRVLLGTTGEPTIGGVVAGNFAGPRRVQGGAARDHLLGVRFVDGTGMVVSNGGRVMKNVTGYDIVKLMAGSWGTLGVLTELSFKVQAMPEAEATVVLPGLNDVAGVAKLTLALGSPYDVTGAAHLPGRTMVRVEGMAGSVSYRAGQLRALLGGGEVLTGAESAALWRAVRDVTAFAGRDGAVWRVSVKPSDGPGIAAAAPGAEVIYDWGGGLVWLLLPENSEGGAGDGGASVVRAAVDQVGGHATLIRGSATLRRRVPVFHPAPAAQAAIARGLRAKFDPRHILNPGLMD